MSARPEVVALVSCVKSKRAEACTAQDLYTSPLFRLSRRYAEKHAGRWFILSAKHGFLEPDKVIEPYEQTLKKAGAVRRAEWSSRVAQSIKERVPVGVRLVVLAGVLYVAGWELLLKDSYTIEQPLRGLGLGKRLRWLRE